MVVAGVFWEILQVVGGIYIGHVLKLSRHATALFGLVIALLVWLHLGAQLTLYAAEINVVLSRAAVAPQPVRAAEQPADEKR